MDRSSIIKSILFIGYVWPEATSTAASQNILSYVDAFKLQGWQVCFASAASQTDLSFDFNAHGIQQQQIVLNDSSFDQFLLEQQADIVVFDRFLSEEQFAWRVANTLPNALRVLDCEDLHCLREARRLDYKRQKDSKYKTMFPKASVPKDLMQLDICKREIAAIFRSDLVIVLSNFERKLLVTHFNVPACLLIQIGFLNRHTNNTFKAFKQRQDFVTIGSFKHEPNWDAVLCLKTHIWPHIRKTIPSAVCHVYGSYMPPKAKALENKAQGFLVHGYVECAKTVLSNARVLLAPINFGAGIKGKLVDAMQSGTPSVTTEIGAEGIADVSQWPGAIAQCHYDFIQEAVTLYNNESVFDIAQHKGVKVLNSMFDHQRHVSLLINKIIDTQRDLIEHRRSNFIGSMLLHHSHASTKYMSQWIEAKSKLLK